MVSKRERNRVAATRRLDEDFSTATTTNSWWWVWRKATRVSKDATGANAIPIGSGWTRAKILKASQNNLRKERGVCLKCFGKGHWQA